MDLYTTYIPTITVSMIVGLLVKALMVLLFVLSLVMVRQAGLMSRVLKLPVGGMVRLVTWFVCVFVGVLAVIVILV